MDGQTTDDKQRLITIVHMSLRLRCTKKIWPSGQGVRLLFWGLWVQTSVKPTLLLIWFFLIQEFKTPLKDSSNLKEIFHESCYPRNYLKVAIVCWILFCLSLHRWLGPLLLKPPSLVGSPSVEAAIVGWVLFCWSLHRWLGPLLLKPPSLVGSPSVEVTLNYLKVAIVCWILFCLSLHRWLGPLLLKRPSLVGSPSVEASIVGWVPFCWSLHRWLGPLLLKPPSLFESSAAKNDCYCFFICTLLLQSSNSLKPTCNMSISNVLNSILYQ